MPKPPSTTPSQAADEQAARLAAIGALPAIGGDGTMTYDEYMALPKKTRIKRMQSITKKMNNNHKERMYVPYVGQRVRSYVITHNDNKCIEQHCVVEDISASDSPIKVSSNDNDIGSATKLQRCTADMSCLMA